MDSPPKTFNGCSFSRSSSLSSQREKDGGDAPSISLQEWQAWGTNSPLPALVLEIAEDLKDLERDVDAHMSFGGIGGKLQVYNI